MMQKLNYRVSQNNVTTMLLFVLPLYGTADHVWTLMVDTMSTAVHVWTLMIDTVNIQHEELNSFFAIKMA
jgi:hypothetical protein